MVYFLIFRKFKNPLTISLLSDIILYEGRENLCQSYHNSTALFLRMYFLQSELKSPHIHTIYGEFVAVISITDSKILFGTLPTKAYNLVKEWLTMYREELLNMWESQTFKRLPPID